MSDDRQPQDENKPVCIYKVLESDGKPKRERRLRRYYATANLFAAYLQAMKHWPRMFERGIVTDLPDDAEVYEIHMEFWGGLWIDMHHPTFDVVPDGQEVPLGMGGKYKGYAWFVRQSDDSYRCTYVGTDDLDELQVGLAHLREEGVKNQ